MGTFRAGAGGIGLQLKSNSSWSSGTLYAPAIRWQEADGTNIGGIRGFVNSSGDNYLALGTGWLDQELLIHSSGITVAGGGAFGADTTITGGRLTITDDTNALRLRSTNNGAGVNINFSDHVGTYAQNGDIAYYHGDGASYGSGNSFVLTGTESTLTVLADGKLMFKEGLYVKPSSGTGAGTQVIDASRNLTNIGTISSGAITSSGNLIAGNSANISMDASGNGQVEIKGSGYTGAIALDGTAMHIYHNSSSRSLVLGTNETARLTITGGGAATFSSTVAWSGGSSTNANTAYTYSQVGHLPLSGGTLTGDLTVSSTSPEIKLVDTNSFSDANDRMIFRAGGNNLLWQWYDNSANSTTTLMTLNNVGQLSLGSNTVFHQGYHPNADKWTTARTITLSGDLSGSVSLDGSANVTLSAQVSNDSHNHSKLVEDSTITFGAGKLQWTDNSGNGGTGGNGAAPANPFSDWHHHLIMNHSNSGGYYVDMAFSFHSDRLHFRRMVNGTLNAAQEIFHDGYHPNADKWTTARTITLSGDLSGSVSLDGSANVTLSAQVSNDSHTHDGRYFTESESDARYTRLDHFRHTGHGNYTSTTTSALLSEALGDDAFDSKLTAHKTSWSYAGNGDLTDAGRLTELAGTSWLWWTDNSTDNVQGNVTALCIAPNTGGSAGKVFIYNNQGSSYAPGWREVWTSTSDGSGSGLDADLLDGQQGSYYSNYNNLSNKPTSLPANGGNSDTVDNLHASSFIRADANDNVGAHTEWQDNYNVRLGNGADFRMWHDGSHTYFRNYNHANGNMYWQGEDSNGTNRAMLYMVTNTSGPYVQLFQAGNEKLRTVSAGVNVYGGLTATGNVTAYSDIRKKTNIQPLEGGLDIVKALEPKRFDWIESGEGSLGFIAQEVEEYLPELVDTEVNEIVELDDNQKPVTTGEEEVKSLDYGKMVSVLWAAVKEQSAQIETLNKRIEELENGNH